MTFKLLWSAALHGPDPESSMVYATDKTLSGVLLKVLQQYNMWPNCKTLQLRAFRDHSPLHAFFGQPHIMARHLQTLRKKALAEETTGTSLMDTLAQLAPMQWYHLMYWKKLSVQQPLVLKAALPLGATQPNLKTRVLSAKYQPEHSSYQLELFGSTKTISVSTHEMFFHAYGTTNPIPAYLSTLHATQLKTLTQCSAQGVELIDQTLYGIPLPMTVYGRPHGVEFGLFEYTSLIPNEMMQQMILAAENQ